MDPRKETPALDCASSSHLSESVRLISNERRTLTVVLITAFVTLVEIAAGYWTGSMALLADGWHMATHAGALAVSVLAYRFARSHTSRTRFTFGGGKVLPLSGYTSAIALAIGAVFVGWESVERYFAPKPIEYEAALIVTVLGLLVNLACAVLLREPHPNHSHSHDHDHGHDHNLRSAYLHVMADALTSVLALAALLYGRATGSTAADALVGLLGALMVLRWAISLARDAALELLDARHETVTPERVQTVLDSLGARLIDLHAWRLSPEALACEVVLESRVLRGANAYRAALLEATGVQHLVIEERLSS